MKKSLAGLLLILSAGAWAQDQNDRYIVELSGEPAAASGKLLARRLERRSEIRNLHRRMRAQIEAEGVEVTGGVDTVANALLIRATPERAARLARLNGVRRVHVDREYYPVLDRAVGLQHVPEAWAQIGGAANAGRGIRIGILDTGIDSSHPGFRDPSLVAPEGYPLVSQDSDRSLTNSKVIVVRNYDSNTLNSAADREGHGTAVAMVAAGALNTGPYGPISGVAPKAFLGSYKVFPDGGNALTSTIIRALDDAVNDGMDVVNLSLGSLPAERPEDDVLVAAVERAVQAGVIVVVAAGNEGPDLNTIGSPGTAPSAITVGNAYNDRIFSAQVIPDGGGGMVAIPGSGPKPARSIRGDLRDVSEFDQNGLACAPLPASSLQGQVALVLRGVCTFSEKIANVAGGGAAAALIYTDAARPDPISMAAGDQVLPATMVGYDDGAELKRRVASGGISVLLTFETAPVFVNASRLQPSTSRGPNTDLAVKPDLLAVGTAIYSAAPGQNGSAAYSISTGTSLSSPMVAGAAAVLKGARPGLTADQYRSLLIHSTSSFRVNDQSLSVQEGGTGLLNLWSAVRGTLAASPASLTFGASDGTVSLSRPLRVTNLSKDAADVSIDVVPMRGPVVPELSTTQTTIPAGGTLDIDARLRGSNLPAGSSQGYIVVRAAQSDVETRIPYWFGVRSGKANAITLLNPPSTGRVNSRQTIRFRITDESGLALSAQPKVSVLAGDGTVTSVQSLDFTFPGVFSLQVRLGPVEGENSFQIEAGEKTLAVRISATP